MESMEYLDETWCWAEMEQGGTVFCFNHYDPPLFDYIERGGKMTGLTFSVQTMGKTYMEPTYQNEMVLAMLSFVKAQKACGIFDEEIKDVIRVNMQERFQSFTVSMYGVDITCEVAHSGFMGNPLDGILWSDGQRESQLSLTFTMQK